MTGVRGESTKKGEAGIGIKMEIKQIGKKVREMSSP